MIETQIQNLQNDLAIITHYFRMRSDGGLWEVPQLLEELSKNIFKALFSANFTNLNRITVNFPTIDLGSEKKRIAVQVTLKVTKTKMNKTILAFKNNNLKQDYDTLYIFGISATKGLKSNNAWCHIWDFNSIIHELRDKNDEFLVQGVVEAVRSLVDYSKLHPMDDIGCLRIILECIDRNAVKHKMQCEGSYDAMIVGLNEITEVISKGTINKREKCKPLGQFESPYIRDFLSSIKDYLSQILAIINNSKGPAASFVYLDQHRMNEIDRIKGKIIADSNQIAQKYKIQINLVAY